MHPLRAASDLHQLDAGLMESFLRLLPGCVPTSKD